MKSLFKPSPLSIAVEQLEDAKRELLRSQAMMEDYRYHAEAEEARAEALLGRIVRLKRTVNELHKEAHEADPS